MWPRDWSSDVCSSDRAIGESDISEVMYTQGLILPAILVLGLNIWTTNDNALYASGLGFSNITKIAKGKMVVLNGIRSEESRVGAEYRESWMRYYCSNH